MEEQIIKLIKVVARNTKLLYQYGCIAETTVDHILDDMPLAIHEEARLELIEYFKKLN